jgi:aminoglycoside phosphotransferase (APT) family kinase protein
VALGRPDEGYPFGWAVQEWLPGENANSTLRNLTWAAMDLAAFITALRTVDTRQRPAPTAGHPRCPAAERDDGVRQAAAAELSDRIDGAAALRSWEQSLAGRVWDSADGWVHGDLLPGNLLVAEG